MYTSGWNIDCHGKLLQDFVTGPGSCGGNGCNHDVIWPNYVLRKGSPYIPILRMGLEPLILGRCLDS